MCRQRDPFSWFLVLPKYPSNLRQWMQQLQGMTLQERLRRVMPVMRQLVQGLAYLHRVPFIATLPLLAPSAMVMHVADPLPSSLLRCVSCIGT